ncbi:MAG: ArsR family transcriptional regulator [Alphaproteobacteria bacterium]|nr:ArsR family transcriptional regulator [Alphaproteobacteria bacterium]
MSYNEFMAANRRITVLRLLKDVGGSANDSIIQQTLEQFGFSRVSSDTIAEDLAFLEKAELVVLETVGTVTVAKIRRRGVEVAEGRVTVEGVQKPSVGV